MSGWIECVYDDDGEIINPEWVDAPDDSFWWVNSLNKLDKVCRKDEIWFRPTKIARVVHPDEPDREFLEACNNSAGAKFAEGWNADIYRVLEGAIEEAAAAASQEQPK